MRLLAAALLILSYVLSSCGSGQPLPEHRVIYDQTTHEELVKSREQQPKLAKYNAVFQMKQDTVYGKMFIKIMPDNSMKIAYTTDSEYKLYAVQLYDSTVVWDYVFSNLNHNFIKRILERDLRAFTGLMDQTEPAKTSREERPHTIIGNSKNKLYIYWTDSTKLQPYKTVYTDKKETLVIVHYLDFNNGKPQRIKLVDHKAQFSLTLTRK